MSEELKLKDGVEIDGCQYAVTYFTADAKGGSLHARKLGILGASTGQHATLLPTGIEVRVSGLESVDAPGVESKVCFEFLP